MEETVFVKKNKKELIICIPTYRRPEVIERFLEKQLPALKGTEVDLCIFDSSEDTDTYDIIKQWRKSGYENLLYERVDSKLNSAEKFLYINQVSESWDYNYLWINHDHTVFSTKGINHVLNMLKKECDIYFLDLFSGKICEEEGISLQNFFETAAFLLSRFGTAIVSIERFAKGFQFDEFKAKYMKTETASYIHIMYYYVVAASHENVPIAKIGMNDTCYSDILPDVNLSWINSVLEVTTLCWGTCIMSLPDCYKRKEKVLTLMEECFGIVDRLLYLKKNKKYGIKDYLKYSYWIKKVYKKNSKLIRRIAMYPYPIGFYLYNKCLIKKTSRSRKHGKKIYIYGAGNIARRCAERLEQIKCEYEGFVVSSMEKNPAVLKGHNVYVAEEELKGKQAYIIIGVTPRAYNAICDTLEKCDAADIEYDLFDYI